MTTPLPLPEPPKIISAPIETISSVLSDALGSIPTPEPFSNAAQAKKFYESPAFWALIAVTVGVVYWLYTKGIDENEETPSSDEPHSDNAASSKQFGPNRIGQFRRSASFVGSDN